MKLRVPGSTESLTIRTASPGETWSYIEKLIAFEEPQERFERLKKLLAKQSGIAFKQLSKLPLEGQQELISAVFGSQKNSFHKQECLLSVVLALEDLRRFQSVVFQSWRHENIGQNIEPDKHLNDKHFKWIHELGKPQDESLWLEHAYKSAPNISVVFEEGQWSKDPRAEFLANCLESFSQFVDHQKATRVVEAHESFRELLGKWRDRLPGSFLPKIVLLVEGPTEALILPHLSDCMSVDFDQLAVLVTACGGAKQVARHFLELRELTYLPIVAVLDRDAEEESEIISELLRTQDRLHVLSNGEIEDIFEPSMLIDLLNKHLSSIRPSEPVLVAELESNERRTELLDRLWRKRGLGDFDKIGFAKTVVQTLMTPQAVPADAKKIINSLKELADLSEI